MLPNRSTEHATRRRRRSNRTHPRDPAREVVETIVFVVVLVLLLKLFVTEAFVIPTGSMAETLYGYQKIITCPKCGHEFPVNSHDEVEGNQATGRKMPLYGYCCPNCRLSGTRRGSATPCRRRTAPATASSCSSRSSTSASRSAATWSSSSGPRSRRTSTSRRTTSSARWASAARRSPSTAASCSSPGPSPTPPMPSTRTASPSIRGRTIRSTSGGRGTCTRTVWDSNPLAEKFFEASRDAGFTERRQRRLRDRPQGRGAAPRRSPDRLGQRQAAEGTGRPGTDAVVARGPTGAKHGELLPWNGNDEQQPTAFRHDKPELDWLRYRHLAMPWKTDGRGPGATICPRPTSIDAREPDARRSSTTSSATTPAATSTPPPAASRAATAPARTSSGSAT